MVTTVNKDLKNEHASDLKKLPWLGYPLLKFDLSRELEELRSRESFGRETGRSSKTLAKHSDFRLVLVLMKPHTQMNQHRSEGPISIHQLHGTACVRLPDRDVILGAGELMVLDGAVLHDIEAPEESAFLLTISWRDNRANRHESAEHSAERTFDDEGLLRMEDEGAPNKLRKWS